MKAAFITQHGTLDEIKMGDDLDVPAIKPTEILVQAKYTALNHLDYFVVKGWPGLTLRFPHVLGSDGSGIVKETGSEVTTVKKGDHVTINPGISCGKCPRCLSGNQNFCSQFSIKGEHEGGTYAEFFTVPEINALKIPDAYPMDKAAAAPLVFLTAWRMLVTRAGVKRDDIVLIHGASGGVATAAIQIAKLFNATVITTTSDATKVAKAKRIGADHVINYKEEKDYATRVFKELTGKRGVDIVIDSVGAPTFETSVRMLKPDGKLVTCGATAGPSTTLSINNVFWKQLNIIGSTMSNQKEFRDVMKHVFDGSLEPVIDKCFPLAEARAAELYLVAGGQFGKVIMQVS